MLEECLEHNKTVSILNTGYCFHCYIIIPPTAISTPNNTLDRQQGSDKMDSIQVSSVDSESRMEKKVGKGNAGFSGTLC